MCLQDYKMGKGTKQNYYSSSVDIGQAVQILKSNAGRHSLIVSVTPDSATDNMDQLEFGVLYNGTVYPFYTFDIVRRSAYLDVSHYGSGLFGPLYAILTGTAAYVIKVIENVFIETPQETVK